MPRGDEAGTRRDHGIGDVEVARTDDTEDVIRRRQQVYRDETSPLLAFYREKLVSVDATGSVEEITDRVTDLLRAR